MTNFRVRRSLLGLLGAVVTLMAGATAQADELPGVVVAISPTLSQNDTCLYVRADKLATPIPYILSKGHYAKADTSAQCSEDVPDNATWLCRPRSAANPAICLDLNDAVPGAKRSALTLSLTPNQLNALASDIVQKLPAPKAGITTASKPPGSDSTPPPSDLTLWVPVLLALAVLALLAYRFPGTRKALVGAIRKFAGLSNTEAKGKKAEGEGTPKTPVQPTTPDQPGQNLPIPPAVTEAAILIEQIKTQVASLQISAARLQEAATDGGMRDRPGANYLLTILDDDGAMTALPLSLSRQERDINDPKLVQPGERLRQLHKLLDTVAVKLADEVSQKLADKLSQVVRDAVTLHGGDTTKLIGDIKTTTDDFVAGLTPLLAEIAGHAAKLEQLDHDEAGNGPDVVQGANDAQSIATQALPDPIPTRTLDEGVAAPAVTEATPSFATHADSQDLSREVTAEDQWLAESPIDGSEAYEMALQNLVDRLYAGKRQLNDVIAEAEAELEGAGPNSLISFVDWPTDTPETKERAKHVAAVLKTTRPDQFFDPPRAEAALNLFVKRLLGRSASVILPRPRQPIDDRQHFLVTSRGAATSSRIKTVYWVGLKCGDDPVLPAGVSDRA